MGDPGVGRHRYAIPASVMAFTIVDAVTNLAHIVGSYTAFLPYLAAASGSSFISALIWPLCAS